MAAIYNTIRKAGCFLGIPLMAGLIATVLFYLPGAASVFQYDRDRVGGGEIWRLFTSHWTHWSAEHLFWDLLVFIVLLGWALKIRPGKTAIVISAASLAIPTVLYWIQPAMLCYRGLSGLDSALMVFVAMQWIQTEKRKDGLDRFLVPGLLVGLAGKIVYEALAGQAVFVSEMAPNVIVVPLAHMTGAAIGFAAALKFPGARDPGMEASSASGLLKAPSGCGAET